MEGKNAEDRISNLPDDILHHILSFLDFAPVVQTSILSRRWISIWSSLRVLNFINSNPRWEPDLEKNELLVYKVLPLRDLLSNIDSIRVSSVFSHKYETWIPFALRRNIQVIDITYEPRVLTYDLPSCLLCCESLKVLKLDMVLLRSHKAVHVCLPPTVNLPNLRQLKLRSICFNSSGFIPKFLGGCPVLDTLSIINCFLHEKPTLVIRSLTLKHLELRCVCTCDSDCWEPQKYRSTENETKFVISAPLLTSFRCSCSIFDKYEIDGQCSLVMANMNLGKKRYLYRDLTSVEKKKAGVNMMEFLRGLHSLKSLKMSASLSEVISHKGGFIPLSFNGLRYLDMPKLEPRDCIKVVLHILKKSPKLETLVLDNSKVEGKFKYREAEATSHCKFHDLTSVEVLGGLHSLKSLTLSGPYFKVISRGGKFIPLSLKELRHLYMKMFLSGDCIQGTLHILENSPKLETLVLDITKVEGSLNFWKAKVSRHCNFNNLKSVEIWNIKGSATELEFLKALLKNAASLEKLTFFACGKHNKTQIEKLKYTQLTLQRRRLPRETNYYFDSCICNWD